MEYICGSPCTPLHIICDMIVVCILPEQPHHRDNNLMEQNFKGNIFENPHLIFHPNKNKFVIKGDWDLSHHICL